MRRNRTALAVPAAVAALLLTACGGSDGGGEGEELIGAEQSGDGGGGEERPEPEASPSEAEETDDGVPRPEIELPDELTLVFDGWESADAEEQAILNDGRERLRSVYAAATRDRNPRAEHVLFYHDDGEALENAAYWIEGFTEYDLTVEGNITYLNPEVTVHEGNAAILNYCANESEAAAVYVDSGERYEEVDIPYLYYATNMRKNEQGVWTTTNVRTQREDCGS